MGWEEDEKILSRLNLVLAKEHRIQSLLEKLDIDGISQKLNKLQLGQSNLTSAIAQMAIALESAINSLSIEQSLCCKQIHAGIAEILQDLIPQPAVSFFSTVTDDKSFLHGEITMANVAKATADLQVADNGTFTVNNTFQDEALVKTAVPPGLSLTYTASDAVPGPSVLTLTPSADTSSCAGAINQATIQAQQAAAAAAGVPFVLPTGLTITVSGSWTGLAAPQTSVAKPPIDVVAGPAGSFVAEDATP